MASKKSYTDFETAIERLEEITDLLEAGDTSLDESIKLYTEGLEIARFCNKQLSATEKKIKIIQEKGGDLVEAEMDAPEDEA